LFLEFQYFFPVQGIKSESVGFVVIGVFNLLGFGERPNPLSVVFGLGTGFIQETYDNPSLPVKASFNWSASIFWVYCCPIYKTWHNACQNPEESFEYA